MVVFGQKRNRSKKGTIENQTDTKEKKKKFQSGLEKVQVSHKRRPTGLITTGNDSINVLETLYLSDDQL